MMILLRFSWQSVAVGSMVQLETVTGDKMCGVVRYCGELHPGTRWAGVELEEEVRGGGQGWVQVSVHITVRPRQIAKLL